MADRPEPSVFARRLRQAREACGLSQKQLGIAAGLDPFVASARINRYETGMHEPNSWTATQLAKALGMSAAYFYAEDDRLAKMIEVFHRLPKREQIAWTRKGRL